MAGTKLEPAKIEAVEEMEPRGSAASRTQLQPSSDVGVFEAPAGLLQRVLLTTDGSVGRMLEVYSGEPVEVVKLDQFTAPCGAEHTALEVAADDEVLWRRVLLRGGRTSCSYMYAEALIALERVHPMVRAGLLSSPAPIGKLLTTVRAETFREVLTAETAPAGGLAAHFGIDEADELYVRTYRIVAGGLPMMLITEKFPTTWFLS